MSKYAQTSPTRVDYHVYPSGNKVIKAFIADIFAFFYKAGNTLELLDNSCLDKAHKLMITWRIQKNHQNGQTITLSAKEVCHQLCPVCAAGKMVLQAQRLGQSYLLPVARHSYKNKRINLTGKRITALF